MPDTNQIDIASTPLLADFRRSLDAARQELGKMTALLQALPPGTPEPVQLLTFGRHAHQAVKFSAEAVAETDKDAYCARMLELLPPLPAVDRHSARVPFEVLTSKDLNDFFQQAHPVGFEGTTVAKPHGGRSYEVPLATWWTDLGEGLGRTEVLVTGVSHRHFQVLGGGYALVLDPARTQENARMFVRVPCPLHAYPQKTSSLATWEEAWTQFATGMNANARAQQFINVARAAAIHKGGLTVQDLPPVRNPRPGTAVKIGPQESFESAVAQMFPELDLGVKHPWYRIGDFWSDFTSEQAAALLALSVSQAEKLVAVKAERMARADEAQAWLTNFLKEFSNIHDNALVLRSIQQALAKEVGNGVGIKLVGTKAGVHTCALVADQGSAELPFIRPFKVEADSSKPELSCANMNLEYV